MTRNELKEIIKECIEEYGDEDEGCLYIDYKF